MSVDRKPPPRAKASAARPRSNNTRPAAPGNALDSAAVLRNPHFQQLVRERTAFGWTLSIIMLVVYLGFIFAVAFGHDFMAAKVAGTEISVGIVAGLAVIILAFALTGIYVARANSRFDRLTRDLMRRP